MINCGPNSNSTGFMISFRPIEYFNCKYVAIGHVVDGENVLDMIENVSARFEKPDFEISISSIKIV